MPTSLVPAVMVELKAQLQARPGLAGVQITDGLAWQPAGDYVAIMDADPHEQDVPVMNRVTKKREERFTLHVVISATRKGDADHTETVARAYALAGELENELREDSSINGTLPQGWAEIDGLPVHKIGPDKAGNREAILIARVSCRGRI